LKEQDYYSAPKNKNSRIIRTLLVVFGILIVCAGVSFYVIYDIISDEDYSSLSLVPGKPIAPVSTPKTSQGAAVTQTPAPETVTYNGKTYARNENIVNLLFLGIDYTEEREELRLGYRSDMVLVCAVDTAEKTASLISIPRDTYTSIYKIDADTGQIKKTVRDKITNAYSFGGGPDHLGPENSMAGVQMFLQREGKLKTPLDFTLNIPVYFYASIDIDGIAPVASSVGGIEVKLTYTIPDVGRKGETVLLKGEKAETYIRDRHNTTGGDIGRAGKEQDFMLKLAKKIKGMGAVEIILSLYDDLQKYVDTNLNTTQMVDFAKILMKVDIDSIKTYTIPGKNGMIDGTSYYIPDEQGTLDILLSVYYKEVS
jgi:anionic cell wall polymer biosynthesis LytR-Cps2A-Psr (LCP) family protein